MGGYGSTRWGYHSAATTVELCLTIDTADMKRGGFFDMEVGSVEQGGTSGNAWPWIHWIRREPSGITLSYTTHWTIRENLAAFLDSAFSDEEPARAIEQQIQLTTTEPRFGGVRYWFVCPECEARVRTLHLPFGYFKRYECRSCHRLTYRSSQQSHTERAQWPHDVVRWTEQQLSQLFTYNDDLLPKMG